MRPELYSITPRVVAADAITEIAVKGNFPHSDLRAFQSEFTVDAVGPGGLFQNGDLPGYTCGNGFSLGRPAFEPIPSVLDENGILHFKYDFKGEGQTTFRITIGERVIPPFLFTPYAGNGSDCARTGAICTCTAAIPAAATKKICSARNIMPHSTVPSGWISSPFPTTNSTIRH